jgi:preprotein translocase subunit SecG
MAHILPYIQILLALIVVLLVLLQTSDADLGGGFGGSDSVNSQARTRRGGERVIFNATILVGVLFVVSAIAGLIIK